MLDMQVDVRALKQALWRSLQEVRAQSADDAELDFQVSIPASSVYISTSCIRTSYLAQLWADVSSPGLSLHQ